MAGGKPTAFEKAVALVNISERSEKGLRERLFREGYKLEEVDDALQRCLEYGFVDDMRFAGLLIRSRINQGKGAAGIERELKSHGIDAADIPGWPEEFCGDDSERQRAVAFLDRHPTRSKNLREGAFRKLVQKGYSASVAADAARIWSEAHTGLE